MSQLGILEQRLAQLLLDKEAAISKHKTARLSSIDRDITQLQNRTHNLTQQNDPKTNH